MASNNQQRREKLVDKDSLNRENNFDAGQSKVKESYLHKTGIRGTKIWILIAILIILLVLCIINLVILAVVYGVIRIDKDGVESLSFFENGMLRWTKPSYFETVTVYQNEIGGFDDRDLSIETTQNQITLHGGPTTRSSQVHVTDGNTTIIAKKGFKFVDPFAEKEALTFNGSSVEFLQESVTGQYISIDTIRSHRFVSNEFQNLTLESSNSIFVQGNEGIKMDGKKIVFDAASDINVTSSQTKTIKLEAKEILLKFETRNTIKKLCVCRVSGKLFNVGAASRCDSINPCP